MTNLDRLSAIMARFELTVRPSHCNGGNLLIFVDIHTQAPSRVVLCPRNIQDISPQVAEKLIFTAQVVWGGTSNPLFSALPDILEINLKIDSETAAIATLLKIENENKRCGSASVLSRLSEILMIRLMRVQIEKGNIEVGIFGGLNDQRLSRAIVAIHDNPSKKWNNQELAQIAGLSLSRFCELFSKVVQETPIAYLRRWRLVLARQDIVKGARIQDIAFKYGYQSGEALTRAFFKQFGETPTNAKKQIS